LLTTNTACHSLAVVVSEDKSREKIKTVESEKSEEETLRAEYEFN
jgi:hypothetical protein